MRQSFSGSFRVLLYKITEHTALILMISSYTKPAKEGFNKRSGWVICLRYEQISANLSMYMLINIIFI